MSKRYSFVLVFVSVQFCASQVLPAVVECASTLNDHCTMDCTMEMCPSKHGSGEHGTHHHDSKSVSVTATCSSHGNNQSTMTVPSDVPHSVFMLDISWRPVSFTHVSIPSVQAGHLRYDLLPPRISSSRV